MSDCLVLDALCFAYGEQTVLEDVTLSVPQGQITALMGPSGCGKSTLLAIAAGLLEPSAGQITRRFSRARLAFQDALLLPWHNALSNVAFALKADAMPEAQRLENARHMLALTGFDHKDMAKFPHQLSGGMRQRVSLARALVAEPDFLLLDEPFSALDVGLARQMHHLVRTEVRARGISALVVSHEPREAARVADRICLLSPAPGRLIAQFHQGTQRSPDSELAMAAEIEDYL